MKPTDPFNFSSVSEETNLTKHIEEWIKNKKIVCIPETAKLIAKKIIGMKPTSKKLLVFNELVESLKELFDDQSEISKVLPETAKLIARKIIDIKPTDFIRSNYCNKKQYKLGLDWQTEGKPIDHPFIWTLMEAYAKKVNK